MQDQTPSCQAKQPCPHGAGPPEVGHPLDVLVPASRNPSAPPWIRVHRSAWMPGAPKRGIPRARADCACLDAAGWARTDREAMFIVVTALQERLVSPAALRRALSDRPTLHRRAQILETVEEYAGGAMSMGEQDFTRLCRKHGIRKPDRQVRRVSRRGTRRIDAYFDAERVVVEIDGIGHVKLEQWMDDHERQNDIVIQGDRTFLRVSTWVLRYAPETFMEQLRQALHEG